MSQLQSKSALATSTIGFDAMIEQFGVVTVMNARVYKESLTKICGDLETIKTMKAHDLVEKILQNQDYVTIDTLKIANINIEGPSKTITGGQYANPLIKFGKTATIEMQDALGRAEVLEVLGGAVIETYANGVQNNNTKVIHMTNNFAGPVTIIGDSFFIDQKTGTQIPVRIALYQVLPDSIFNLTQDSEGDATVFDLNGALLTTDILVGDEGNDISGTVQGVFYSILPQNTNYQEQTYAIKYQAANDQSIPAVILNGLNETRELTVTDTEGNVTPVVAGYKFTTDPEGKKNFVGPVSANTTLYVSVSA